jgi:heat shock protein HslJ
MNEKKMNQPTCIPTGRYSAYFAITTFILLITACSLLPPSPSSVKSAASTVVSAYSTQITGKTWLLAGYAANGTFIPLEPGQGTTGRIVFKADGTLIGTTGINTFAGSWKMKNSNKKGIYQFTVALSDISKKEAPNDIALKFDRDILGYLAKTHALKMEKDSIKLIDERNETLIRFIFLESDQN